MSVLIIVPTFNEVLNIRRLVDRILVAASHAHILFVDDNSGDGTQAAILTAQERYQGRIFLKTRPGKMGLGSAYVEGFRWGLEHGYQKLIEMDADFSHDPAYLPTMIAQLGTTDVVIGSRYVAGGGTVNWSLSRKLISRFGSLYAKLVLGLPIFDCTGGFNGWQRKVLETVDLGRIRSDGYAFQIELKYRANRAGFKLREFPIVFKDRRAGASKMTSSIVLEAIWKIWLFRFSR